jgi:hypothetical protein
MGRLAGNVIGFEKKSLLVETPHGKFVVFPSRAADFATYFAPCGSPS